MQEMPGRTGQQDTTYYKIGAQIWPRLILRRTNQEEETDRQTELEEGDTTSGSEPSTVNQTGGEEQEQLHLLK